MKQRQCDFDCAGTPATTRCQQPGNTRVWYRVDPETESTCDWRRYCRKHAEQYADTLRAMACVTAVEVRDA